MPPVEHKVISSAAVVSRPVLVALRYSAYKMSHVLSNMR
jgi:hypothetical protein